MHKGLIYLVVLVLVAGGAASSAQSVPDPVVTVRTVWSADQAHGGDRRVLAVVVDIHEGFHINPRAQELEDDLLIPTQLEAVETPGEVSVSRVRYPAPGLVTVGPIEQPRQVLGYERRVVLHVPVRVAGSSSVGVKRLELNLTYQACDRTRCLAPVTVLVAAELEVVADSVAIDETVDSELFGSVDKGDGWEGAVSFDAFGFGFSVNTMGWVGFAALLAVAGLGGLLLNFTPCVLPVIPLKMMGLSQAAGNRGRCLALGVAMSGGVVAFWVGLGAMIAAVGGFSATNQLFQYPLFTIGVGVVIAVMAAGMWGVYTTQLPRWVYAIDPRADSLGGSFVLGVMTAVLSTPCTAPFMGAAAAWAAGQRVGTTLTTFGAIGGGMALPYLLLAAFPMLISRMPRTGPASELIKQVMGLLLGAVAAYFVGVGLTGLAADGAQPTGLAYWWAVMAFVACGGVWLAWRGWRVASSRGGRAVLAGLGVLIVAGALYGGVRLTDKGTVAWVYYTPDRFDAALRDGNVVVMDFTAEWCLNCKWLEKNVLNRRAVADLLNSDGVVPMKVDLTGTNPTGASKLKEVGRVAIPLLVVFAPDGREVFKSDFYAASQVVEAIEQAAGR